VLICFFGELQAILDRHTAPWGIIEIPRIFPHHKKSPHQEALNLMGAVCRCFR